jgi:hypothetical protein
VVKQHVRAILRGYWIGADVVVLGYGWASRSLFVSSLADLYGILFFGPHCERTQARNDFIVCVSHDQDCTHSKPPLASSTK